jgi:putative phosphoesterase
MRIGVLSDTHIPEAPVLFPEILEALTGVDLILHAGDIVVARVLDELEQVAPVLAAEGNHDYHLASDPRIELLHRLELEGHTLALLHTFEPTSPRLERLVRLRLDGVRPDVVVCGDSHVERIDVVDGVLVLNAGSATLPRNRSPRLGHVAFLALERGRPPQATIVDLGEPHWRDHEVFRTARRL